MSTVNIEIEESWINYARLGAPLLFAISAFFAWVSIAGILTLAPLLTGYGAIIVGLGIGVAYAGYAGSDIGYIAGGCAMVIVTGYFYLTFSNFASNLSALGVGSGSTSLGIGFFIALVSVVLTLLLGIIPIASVNTKEL